ncbi:MAG: helix-turn-helix domain-containing protein, partial [Actinomycetota bacterium]
MLGGRELLRVGDVSVTEIRCDGGSHGWSEEEIVTGFGIVLVRVGAFRRQVEGGELLADPMVAYCQLPGSVQQVAHPCGGDVCTVIGLSSWMVGSLIDPERLSRDAPLSVSSAVDFAHRLLLGGIRKGADRLELA